MNLKLALASMCLCVPCWAQQAPAPKAPSPALLSDTAAAENTRTGEANVKRTVIEDEGSRIEELRVRGETQRIVVTPKIGIRQSYEILSGDASRDAFDGTGGPRSSAGKRVWNVLKF
jgi:hypothetical protein